MARGWMRFGGGGGGSANGSNNINGSWLDAKTQDASAPAPLLQPEPLPESESLKEAASKILMSLRRESLEVGPKAPNTNSFNIFDRASDEDARELTQLSAKSLRGKRAMGAMVGMAVADSIGHNFEFIEVDKKGCRFDPSSLKVVGAYNKFKLKPGQWTDDTSMGLCLADSLLTRGIYNGTDIRVRFWNWWYRGYNNAFQREGGRSTSIGLGGNISSSLADIRDANPTPRFESPGDDAGNGSLMRLAPIPILFHMDSQLVMRMSAESSATTHPGPIAANTCAFLGFLIARAITRNSKETAAQFLDACVSDFALLPEAAAGTELMRLLRSAEPVGSKERCWNWRDRKGPYLIETVEARGKNYNGYPVSKGYFGSYSIDGLAMALHSFYHTKSFMAALACCVNMLGDADSTGAILGQLAGAFYGLEGIDKRLVDRLHTWDHGEIALRGALLYRMGLELSDAALDSAKCVADGSPDANKDQLAIERLSRISEQNETTLSSEHAEENGSKLVAASKCLPMQLPISANATALKSPKKKARPRKAKTANAPKAVSQISNDSGLSPAAHLDTEVAPVGLQASDLLNNVIGPASKMRPPPFNLQALQSASSSPAASFSKLSIGSISEPSTPRDFCEALRLMGWYSEPGSPMRGKHASAESLGPLSSAILKEKLNALSSASPRQCDELRTPSTGSILPSRGICEAVTPASSSMPNRGICEASHTEMLPGGRNAPGTSEPSTPMDFCQALRRVSSGSAQSTPSVDKQVLDATGQELCPSGPKPNQKMHPGSEFSTPRRGVSEEPHARILPADGDRPGAVFKRSGSLEPRTSVASLASRESLLIPGPLPGTPVLGPSIPEANVPTLFLTPI